MAVIESGIGSAADGPAIVLHTEIRGTAVTARFEDGLLLGDEELVRRVTNLAVWRHQTVAELEPAELISLAREACAAPIEAELLLPDRSDRSFSDPDGGRPTAPGSRSPRTT